MTQVLVMCPQPLWKTDFVFRSKQSGIKMGKTSRALLREHQFGFCAPNLFARQNVSYAPSSLEHIMMCVLTVLVCKDNLLDVIVCIWTELLSCE